MIEFFILLIIFQIKHLIADYYLQYPYMYENKGKPKDWAWPLFEHSSMHGGFTLGIIASYMALFTITLGSDVILIAVGLATFDLVTHFCIDRWKATRKGGPDTKEFWVNLGIDQSLHHIVGIIIIMIVLGL